MARKILILGASYGSLLGTKLLAAGQNVTLVCRAQTAALINAEGTEVRIPLKGEDAPRVFKSGDQPGSLDAVTPADADPASYDLVALAMSEPQYGEPEIRVLLERIAKAAVPCLSIMNMPPLPYLRRIPGLDAARLGAAYNAAECWKDFEPGLVTLCSPDPQAFRLPDAGANVLQVGLPTNFKAAPFEDPRHTLMLKELEAAIDEVRVDGKDVPVKLRVFDSLFVPFAKWAMLLTGNYRCVLPTGMQPIRDAVVGDPVTSERIYHSVCDIVARLGADAEAGVPYEKYARAAEGLLKPSSAARAIDGGAEQVERVDLLVQLIAEQLSIDAPEVGEVVATVNSRLAANRRAAA